MTAKNNILIAYYSWSGNTRLAAKQIQELTGGTLFEIKPVKEYPVDYNACVEQASGECREGAKPALTAVVDEMGKYDVIFVGSPNWWYTIAPPVLSFLSSYDLSGKTIIPFITHGGGGMSNCEMAVRKACQNSTVLAGKAFNGSSVRQANPELERFVNDQLSKAK